MKTFWKVILVILAVVATIVIAASIAISPVAKGYLNTHGQELIGRDLSINKLSINIFTGSIRFDSLKIYSPDQKSTFLAIAQFKTRISLPKLLNNKVKVDGLLFDNLEVYITQQGDKFNFDDIVAHFQSDEPAAPKAESESKWVVALYDIRLSNSHIVYRDLIVGSIWNLKNVNLAIPDIVLGTEQDTDVGLNLNFVDGGVLRAKLATASENKSYNLSVALDDFAFTSLLPYLRSTIAAESLEGTLSASLTLAGSTDHLMAFDLGGNVQIDEVSLSAKKNETIGSIKSLNINIGNINPSRRQVNIDRIELNGFSSGYTLFKDSTTNFSRLMAAAEREKEKEEPTQQQPDTLPESQPYSINIGSLVVRDGEFTYTDNTLPKRFEYTLSGIAATALNFNPQAVNHVRVAATLQQQGSLKADWTGDLKSMKNQNITIAIQNIALKEFSPYALYYTGFPVETGTLGFVSQNVIADYQLNGTNKLDIFGCEVGKKDKSITPEYKIPLRTGLYILKDKNNRINIDLPVSGNVDSPEFSYKKLIFKTLANLMVKVVTTPARYLGEALGLSNSDLKQIGIEPLQFALSSEQYAAFDQLAAMLRDKSQLQLTLTQQFNFGEAVQQQSLNTLLRHYYKATKAGGDTMRLELIDLAAIAQINTKSPQFTAFADSLLKASSLPVNQKNIQQKANALYSSESTAAVEKIMERRNTAIADYLTQKQHIAADRFKVESMTADQMKRYRGKPCYKVAITLEGAEAEQYVSEETTDEQADTIDSDSTDHPAMTSSTDSSANDALPANGVSSSNNTKQTQTDNPTDKDVDNDRLNDLPFGD